MNNWTGWKIKFIACQSCLISREINDYFDVFYDLIVNVAIIPRRDNRFFQAFRPHCWRRRKLKFKREKRKSRGLKRN